MQTPLSVHLTAPVWDAALNGLEQHLPLAVAFSGGADSTALLLACWRRWPGQVAAVHVNHGLQAAAAEFESFCKVFCAERAIPLHVAHVDAHNAVGESPQDAARKVRYLALVEGAGQLAAQMPMPIAAIALAQHADDQIETLLLALSRGAGLPGLAAMPKQWQRDGVAWVRPLLHVPGHQLRDWLTQQAQSWVEDPSNAKDKYTRNRIRHTILPALEQVFPAFRETFARSSEHAFQAQQLLDDLAVQDIALTGVPPSIKALQDLSQARQANVLRHWLRHEYGVAAQQRQLQELQRQIAACTTRGHRIHIKVANGFVERKNQCLHWVE